MKPNLGTLDRVLRLVFGGIVAALYLSGRISSTVAIVLIAVSAIFALTSAVGFCPIYRILGISSKKL